MEKPHPQDRNINPPSSGHEQSDALWGSFWLCSDVILEEFLNNSRHKAERKSANVTRHTGLQQTKEKSASSKEKGVGRGREGPQPLAFSISKPRHFRASCELSVGQCWLQCSYKRGREHLLQSVQPPRGPDPSLDCYFHLLGVQSRAVCLVVKSMHSGVRLLWFQSQLFLPAPGLKFSTCVY